MSTWSVKASIELTSSAGTIAGYRLAARRLWLAVEFERRQGGRLLRDCLVDTGAPFCVIPHTVHHSHDLLWQRVS